MWLVERRTQEMQMARKREFVVVRDGEHIGHHPTREAADTQIAERKDWDETEGVKWQADPTYRPRYWVIGR